MRLAVMASHPIQYQAPLFRALAAKLDLSVFFAHRAKPTDQSKAGFGSEFDWDIDLLSGYQNVFLDNVSKRPGLDRFLGCDTPDIAQYISRNAFDAVLVTGWNLKCFAQALLAAKRQKLPVLARGDSQLSTPRSPLKKIAKACTYPAFLRLFDGALYVGERSRAYWSHYHYPSARQFFSPHSIDTERFKKHATTEARAKLRTRLGVKSDSKLVLFAGKLVPFKRPLDLIASAAHLKQRGRDIELLVAGSGPLMSDLVGTAKNAGVRCHMLGFYNQTEMPAAYAASDALVLPSDGNETWGLVANEALACGRPIVLSNAAGAAPDLAADGSVGRTYSVGDISALSSSLDDVLAHPPSREALAAKSARYSIAAAAEGIVRATAYTSRM